MIYFLPGFRVAYFPVNSMKILARNDGKFLLAIILVIYKILI